MSIRCPAATCTIARFVSLRFPKPRAVRLRLPTRFKVFTLNTFTPNTFSTAILISVLLASGATKRCTCCHLKVSKTFRIQLVLVIHRDSFSCYGSYFTLSSNSCCTLTSCRAGNKVSKCYLREDHIICNYNIVSIKLIIYDQMQIIVISKC